MIKWLRLMCVRFICLIEWSIQFALKKNLLLDFETSFSHIIERQFAQPWEFGQSNQCHIGNHSARFWIDQFVRIKQSIHVLHAIWIARFNASASHWLSKHWIKNLNKMFIAVNNSSSQLKSIYTRCSFNSTLSMEPDTNLSWIHLKVCWIWENETWLQRSLNTKSISWLRKQLQIKNKSEKSGIWTHASEEITTLTWRLRPTRPSFLLDFRVRLIL